MKKNFLSWLFISLFAVAGLTACDDDDDDTNGAVVFPSKLETITADAGETREITFNASANWSLTSSELWCTFGEAKEYSLNGSAGEQTITLNIGDEAQSNDALSLAHITLTYGNESAVLVDVARNARGFEFVIKDTEGNIIDPEAGVLEAAYDGFKNYTIEANFRFAATNRPEWVNLKGGSIVGTPNAQTEAGFEFNDKVASIKYAIEDGKITFSDEKGLWNKAYNITYKGMNPTAIEVGTPSNDTWNWEVSLDGRTIVHTSGSAGNTGEVSTYNKYVPFTVSALNDEYQIVIIDYAAEWDDWQVMSLEEDLTYNADYTEMIPAHIVVEDKDRNGNIRMYFQDRSACEIYVLAVSKAKWEEVKDTNLKKEFLDVDDEWNVSGVKNSYLNSNLLIHYIQKEMNNSGEEKTAFEIIRWGYEAISFEPETDSDILFWVTSEAYGSKESDVYRINANPGDYLTVCPFMDPNDWDSTNEVGGTMDSTSEGLYFEPGYDQAQQNAAVSFSVPNDFTMPIFIDFHDMMWQKHKVLVIHPNEY